MEKGDRGRIALTAGGLILSAPASYVVQRALGAWAVLDGISDGLGKWLKIHVPPATAGWTIALALVLALYGLLLWSVWRPRHVHDGGLKAGSAPVAATEAALIRGREVSNSTATEDATTADAVSDLARIDGSHVSRNVQGPRPARLRPDAALREGLLWTLFGDWSARDTDVVLNAITGRTEELNDALTWFHQLAFEGEIATWGKNENLGSSSVYHPIEPKFWQHHTVTLIDALKEKSPTSGGLIAQVLPAYTEVRINRGNFEEAWRNAR